MEFIIIIIENLCRITDSFQKVFQRIVVTRRVGNETSARDICNKVFKQ